MFEEIELLHQGFESRPARRVVAGIERRECATHEEDHAVILIGADPAEVIGVALANELAQASGGVFARSEIVNAGSVLLHYEGGAFVHHLHALSMEGTVAR